MKKYLLFAVMIMFLLPMVMGLTFDNIKSYDEDKKEITIKDNFGLGGELVRITLLENTDICLTDCYAIWNVTISKDDDNFLSDLIFENLDENEVTITNSFEYISGYDTITFDDYAPDCKIQDDLGRCANVKVGSHEEQQPIWSSFDTRRKLPAGDYVIKLKGRKQFDKTVDWIPTFYGKEVREWAFWASTPPNAYYRFNENADTTQAIDSAGGNNLTFLLPDAGNFSAGFLNNAINLNFTGNGAITLNSTNETTLWNYGTGAFTISYWINGSGSPAGTVNIMGTDSASSQEGWAITKIANNTHGFGGNGVATVDMGFNVSNSTWNYLVWVREDTGADGFKLYLNNNNVKNATFSDDLTNTTALKLYSPSGDRRHDLDDLQFYKGFAWTPADVDFSFNGGLGREANISVASLVVSLDLPVDATSSNDQNITFNASGVPELTNITNATLLLYDSVTNLFNSTVNIMDTTDNSTTFNITSIPIGNYLWNVEMCGTNNTGGVDYCRVAASNFTLNIQGFTIFQNFSNNFTYETASETYQDNITLKVGETISSVDLIYNGTVNAGTSTLITGQNFTLQATIDIPVSAVGQTTQWFWNVSFVGGGTQNTTPVTQPVGAINLSIFGEFAASLPYINFTFTNETVAQEDISATASTTWTYFLGSGGVTKTLQFTNSSENLNYSFSFAPQNRTLFTDLTFDYNNGGSQQRRFQPSRLTLTNLTLSQVLFLLPTSNGIFQQFVTQDLIGNTVQQVGFVINRSIGGVNSEIASGTTDDSGFAQIFLNPDFNYDALFTKTGFIDNPFSFSPSAQLRTVIMGTSSTATNGSTIIINTNLTITPANSSLLNQTDYLFSFNVSSVQDITLITMNITNLSGYQVGFQTNSGVGFISQTINTGSNTTFIGEFIYSTGDGNETITYNRRWQINNNFIGDYSLFRQLTLYMSYGFSDFIRIFIVLSLIISVLIFMSTGEVIDSSESKVVVAVLLVWAFSVVGWLDTGLGVTGGNIGALSALSNQYGIAILTTGGGVYFVFRKLLT